MTARTRLVNYNRDMALEVDAVYENGVLRPLQPLDLREHERVIVSVIRTNASHGGSTLAVEYIEKVKRKMESGESATALAEVRRKLAKIPGSMAAAVIAERRER